VNVLLPPAPDCRRLRHSIQYHRSTTSTAGIEFCAVCSLGYEMALPGGEQQADDFVRYLRQEQTPPSRRAS
jgi:hypothetical protein